MARRRLTVPNEVCDVARRALATTPSDVPEVAYRLASGFALPDDVEALALWGLDNSEQFNGTRCTVTAALRGGNAGMKWALAAALDGAKDDLINRSLEATVRSDQQLTVAVAGVIVAAWDRQMDHSERKARVRVGRSGPTSRQLRFDGWPNREVATFAGIDDLMDRAWDAFVATLSGIFGEYAKTQASIVAAVDEIGAESVRHAIVGRVQAVVQSLTGFLEQRAREYILGDVPYAPQDYAAARTVAAWVSGAAGSPAGFTFSELALGQFATAYTTAQETILAAAALRPERMFVWIHSFYGAPLKPFPAHEVIDGDLFTAVEVATMTLWPGDHPGCRCALIPTWGV